MDKQHWKNIQFIFDAALELEPEKRDAYLNEACAEDEGLLKEVRSLLNADSMASSVLDNVSLPVDDETTITIGISKEIGPYKVIGKIGMGGMGIVYKGIDSRLDRCIAIKCLSPQVNVDENARQRFITEARAASRLDHANICIIYDIGETSDNQLYFTMPFYDGDTLKQRIKRGTLSVTEILFIVNEVGKGLIAAHQESILHRDIKPANIMLTRDGAVKILDFGVAKISGVENTNTGAALGTVAYMSPEQLKGEAVDKRTDIWSLGIILYEMFAGARPFKGKFTHDMMYSILNHDIKNLSDLIQDAPVMLNDILQRALSRDMNIRYSCVDEMLKDLSVLSQQWSGVDAVILKHGGGDDLHESGGSSSSSVTHWNQVTLETISRELTQYLGPMASVLVKKQSLKSVSVKELCEKLAENLSDDHERKQFHQKIKSRQLSEDSSSSGVSSSGHISSSAKVDYSDEDLNKLEVELMLFIGPISAKLVRRMSKTTPDLKSLIERLTDYLEVDEKPVFLKKTRALFQL